jgi:hypothetical protein
VTRKQRLVLKACKEFEAQRGCGWTGPQIQLWAQRIDRAACPRDVSRVLATMEQLGLVERLQSLAWKVTEKGRAS